MSFTLGLRIATVIMMGWVVAHAARMVLQSALGRERLPPRALTGEVLTGAGAFVIGWALLPGGTAGAETVMMLVGCLTWAVGIAVQPPVRVTPDH
jgi:drug/metabolite transporter (DMT)-like permease